MIPYLLKSTIILGVTYGFNFFFLRHLKTFVFNRFYLLFSILFSLVVPLLEIRVGFNAPLGQSLNGLGYHTGELIQGELVAGTPVRVFNLELLVKILYGVVSAVFLMRFLMNIVKILRKTRNAISVSELSAQLCLVEEQTLPYSFFKRIVVNREEYEHKKIDAELMLHEEAHCNQYHSADILAIELLKTVTWFNPFIWMFKKAIQVNHEFLADHSVLTASNQERYLHILVNLTIRNNSAYLASDFNFSLTKKRLMMMTLNNVREHSAIKRLAAIPLFILLAVTITFSQEDKPADPGTVEEVISGQNDWWKPILEKHNIEIAAYNNFEYVFEMGSTNSIDNLTVTLTDAFILLRNEGDEYTMIRSPKAFHDLETNTISGAEGVIESYNPEKGGLEPVRILQMKDFKFHIEGTSQSYEANEVKGSICLD